MSDLQSICLEVVKLSQSVGEFIRNEVSKVDSNQIETKSLNSLVSYVDKTAEASIVEKL